MGWTFLYNCPDKSQVIEECVKEQSTHVCIAKSVLGNSLWTVWRHKTKLTLEIVLFRLGKDNGSWGYKDMTEGMGPCYYDCPLSFLNLVPEPTDSPHAKGWREKVREHHAKEKGRRSVVKSLKVGSMVRLAGCTPSEFRVTSLNPLRGTSSSGDIYKLIKVKITEVF